MSVSFPLLVAWFLNWVLSFFSRLWEPHRLLMWFGSLMQWFRTLLLGCREGGGGRGRRCGSC